MDERPIKLLCDGSRLCYRRGSIDAWQVRRVWPGRTRYHVPKDKDYLTLLYRLALRYGTQRVYLDFRRIYEQTDKVPRQAVLDEAAAIAAGYGRDHGAAEYLLSVLYMTMVSEENKSNTRLGRCIKALAVYQVLWEGAAPAAAALFSIKKPAEQIRAMCEERGIPR